MKHLILLMLIAAFTFSCGNKNARKEAAPEGNEQAAPVYTVDELYSHASDLVDREVTVKGTVMHVCKQGGGRCFLMGSNEDFNIRIEAGEKIGAFKQEQMGSELTITGIFKEVKTPADAHKPSGEHTAESKGNDQQTEEAHRVIVQAEENADVVYFMEGIEVVKEEM